MEEKLILSVSQFPELFNVSLKTYRDIGRKAQIWREISSSLGLPEDDCRRRWKNLRDRYLKERRAMKEKRSGSGAEQKATWKYFSIMTFLDPHVKERETSSNMAVPQELYSTASTPPLPLDPGSLDEETFVLNLTPVYPELSQVSTSESLDAEASQGNPNVSFRSLSAPVANVPACAAQPSPSPPIHPGHQGPGKAKSKRQRQELDAFEQQVIAALGNKPDEEELFLMSLAPRLRNLSNEKRSQVKIEFLTSLHRAEFS